MKRVKPIKHWLWINKLFRVRRMARISKHLPGRTTEHGHREKRRRRNKRQRQARRYARLCATGGKHRWKGKR